MGKRGTPDDRNCPLFVRYIFWIWTCAGLSVINIVCGPGDILPVPWWLEEINKIPARKWGISVWRGLCCLLRNSCEINDCPPVVSSDQAPRTTSPGYCLSMFTIQIIQCWLWILISAARVSQQKYFHFWSKYNSSRPVVAKLHTSRPSELPAGCK